MSALKIVAILLIAAGIIGLVYGGITYTKSTHDAKLGPIEVSITDKETSNRLMSQKRWGDAVVYRVLREGQELTLTAHLRRSPPKAKSAPAAGGGQ